MSAKNQSYREFQLLVRNYCACIEGCAETGSDFLRVVRDRLLPLYGAALSLPEVRDARFEDLIVDDEKLRDERFAIADRLSQLGFVDVYRFVYEPLQNDADEPMHGSLLDDLSDIWWDLKPGLYALDNGSEEQAADVFWAWKESFGKHWHRHAVD